MDWKPKVERGIPMPKKNTATNLATLILRKLKQPGDSVLVPSEKWAEIVYVIRHLARKMNIKIITRAETEKIPVSWIHSDHRIWRAK